jgi:hypothetical protein
MKKRFSVLAGVVVSPLAVPLAALLLAIALEGCPDPNNFILNGAISISSGSGPAGAPSPGDSLTANVSGIPAGAGSPAYLWKWDGLPGTAANISDGAAYTVVDADLGHRITVTVTYSGISGSKTSAPTEVVVISDLNGAVTISGGRGPSGGPVLGDTLTADVSGIPNGAGSPAYQWKRDGTTSTGTGDSYTVVDADVGHTLTVTVTYANGSKTSDPTAAVLRSAPAFVPVTNITGLPTGAIVGTGLALSGTVAPADATNKTIAWSVASAGATGASIVDGNKLHTTSEGTATVTATIINGASETTNYTQDFDIDVIPALGGSVSITGGNGPEGAPLIGDSLIADISITNGSGIPAFQWKRDGTTSTGTNAAYTVVAADLGHTLRVTVTYTNGSITSAPTAAVVSTAMEGAVTITGGSGPGGTPLIGDSLTANNSITNGTGSPS